MASDKKKAVAVERQMKLAGEILGRLWALTAQVCPPTDAAGAFIYDELHGGTSPLFPLLQGYAGQIEAIDDKLEHLHAEPIEIGPFAAKSWHGVLAQWCGRVVAFSGVGAAGMRRRFKHSGSAGETLDAANAVFRMHVLVKPMSRSAADPEPAAAGPTGLRVGHSCPVMRLWAIDTKQCLEWFAGHIGKAFDGMLLSGNKLMVGLDKEQKATAAAMNRVEDVSNGLDAQAIIERLAKRPATIGTLCDAVAASRSAGDDADVKSTTKRAVARTWPDPLRRAPAAELSRAGPQRELDWRLRRRPPRRPRLESPFEKVVFRHSGTRIVNLRSRIGADRYFHGNHRQVLDAIAVLIARNIRLGKTTLLVSRKKSKEFSARYLAERLAGWGITAQFVLEDFGATAGRPSPAIIPVIHYGVLGVNDFADYESAYCINSA